MVRSHPPADSGRTGFPAPVPGLLDNRQSDRPAHEPREKGHRALCLLQAGTSRFRSGSHPRLDRSRYVTQKRTGRACTNQTPCTSCPVASNARRISLRPPALFPAFGKSGRRSWMVVWIRIADTESGARVQGTILTSAGALFVLHRRHNERANSFAFILHYTHILATKVIIDSARTRRVFGRSQSR